MNWMTLLKFGLDKNDSQAWKNIKGVLNTSRTISNLTKGNENGNT